MRRIAIAVILVAAATTLSARPRSARACGGCFSPPETITSVDSHRMVIALSAGKTILWDQIRYTGDPQDFVWVLPVPSDQATLGIADSAFFEDLEAGTAPQIQGPPPPQPQDCPPPPDNGGVASPDASPSADAGVTVVREETVGPYETVLLTSEDPGALLAWLNGHGYNVPLETLPVITHYTNQQSLFYVLRLAPQQGVSAMQPVRVEYPGYMATFPLRMVTAGAYGKLGLSLWVVAEQRYESRNYGTYTIPQDQLVWDFATGTSNYGELFRSTIDDHGGKAWIAEYAQPLNYIWFYDRAEVDRIEALIPYPFLTRLRTDLLIDHVLADLELSPAADPSWLSNYIQVWNAVNTPPPPSCPDWNGDGQPDTWDDYVSGDDTWFGCQAGGAAGGGALLLIAIGAILRGRMRGRWASSYHRWTRSAASRKRPGCSTSAPPPAP